MGGTFSEKSQKVKHHGIIVIIDHEVDLQTRVRAFCFQGNALCTNYTDNSVFRESNSTITNSGNHFSDKRKVLGIHPTTFSPGFKVI